MIWKYIKYTILCFYHYRKARKLLKQKMELARLHAEIGKIYHKLSDQYETKIREWSGYDQTL